MSAVEAERKRTFALQAARASGFPGLVVTSPPNVRWLLCGRGRPIDYAGTESPYAVVVSEDGARVYVQDIEGPRVAAEERFEELGYETVESPWFEAPPLPGGLATDDRLEDALAPHRRALVPEEQARYRAAAQTVAACFVDVLPRLASSMTELEAGALLAGALREHDLFPRVLLVAGAGRQVVHRHPLPTRAPLDGHALLAVTAEREGLHVSMTRLVSFGPPPDRLTELVRTCAEVDAAMLRASRPGVTTGDVLDAAAHAYEGRGFPDEWRHHHQGGITGYRGREVFAVPGDPTELVEGCAVAWNPSITGGAKSEDTALVFAGGVEVLTRTPELPELLLDGLPRPAILEL